MLDSSMNAQDMLFQVAKKSKYFSTSFTLESGFFVDTFNVSFQISNLCELFTTMVAFEFSLFFMNSSLMEFLLIVGAKTFVTFFTSVVTHKWSISVTSPNMVFQF